MLKILFAVLFFMSSAAQAEMTHYVLNADINGYVGVGGKIDGVKNPDLRANHGDLVMITIINLNHMPHDIALDQNGVKSPLVRKLGEKTTVHFRATVSEDYYCTLPGHDAAGMRGRFLVQGAHHPRDPNQGGGGGHDHDHDHGDDHVEVVDSIVKRGDDIPPPLTRQGPREVVFDIVAKEVKSKLDDQSTYVYWTYNQTIPGPMLRVREGDTVVVNLKNDDHDMVHSIDFHAAQMEHGGAHVLHVPPKETRTLRFVARKAGLYVYHCATAHVPTHISLGMYGMILVEPKEGLPKVDREFYVMQGEYYTKELPGFRGHHRHDSSRTFDERPTYVVMNGRPKGLTGDMAMKARAGEKIRIFFGVGGPNLVSSFHVVGEIFDKVHPYGSFDSAPFYNVQTLLVPAGGATVVEFVIDTPGKYVLVDHSISRVEKGAAAVIDARSNQ